MTMLTVGSYLNVSVRRKEAIGIILADTWLSTPAVSMKYNALCTPSK
jgi:hypothetical protein